LVVDVQFDGSVDVLACCHSYNLGDGKVNNNVAVSVGHRKIGTFAAKQV
jgi:hypothetical protein